MSQQTQQQTQDTSKITFKVHKKDGSLMPGVIKAFLVRMRIRLSDSLDGYIEISEHKLQLILEPDVQHALDVGISPECIISCQFRWNGHFAVARLWKAKQVQV